MNCSLQPGSRAASLRLKLYARSGAQAYGLGESEFGDVLQQVAAKYLPANVSPEEAETFCQSLHLEELVLCSACAAGHERAWEVFLTRYRARLYEMAMSIAGREALARELADSVYADLYGLKMRGEQRLSKLSYYTGRGSLEGWLRAVLAQSFVDR
jgi:RNA polymerase sigma-70 factor (ECF subfamily)